MDMNFERAEYVEPKVIDAVGVPLGSRPVGERFGLALGYGAVAAAVGSVGYALVGLTGFMVSIVAIGMGWLVGKAMMTASRGVGGRAYQVAAVVLTYFSVTFGHVLNVYWMICQRGEVALGQVPGWLVPFLLKLALMGPFLALRNPLNGGIGLLILFFGLQMTWRLGAGGPGFSRGSVRR